MAMPRVTSNQQKVKDWRHPLVQVCKYSVLNLSGGSRGWMGRKDGGGGWEVGSPATQTHSLQALERVW